MAFLQFCETYNNQIWKNDRLVCTEPALQVAMISPPSGHVTSIYEFFSTSIRLKISKLGKMIDQYVAILPYNWRWRTTSRSQDKHLQHFLHFYEPYINETWQDSKQHAWKLSCKWSWPLCHVTNVFGFIFTSISPITSKLERIKDQHVLFLLCRWQWNDDNLLLWQT